MRTLALSLAAAVAATTIAAAPRLARADAAFELQPALGIGTSIQPASTSGAGATLPQASFTFLPILRIGVAFRPVSFLIAFSYSSSGTSGLVVNGVGRVGLDLQLRLWHASDDRVRMYALLGVGALIAESGVVNAMGGRLSTTDAGVSLGVGFGGQYAVHPNFLLGLELAARPDLIPLQNALYFDTEVYVAVTGAFVTGRRR
jgi:hypothetical protein